MKIKQEEIQIDETNPFINCQLDREKYAKVLTGIIESYSSGFVLAINNKWGTGKTTFVKMLNQYLLNKDFKTIYFNSWENDFEDNPLTALVGELKALNNTENKKFNDVLKNAALISKNIIPAVVKAIANKYLDSELLVDTITESAKSTTEIFEKDVNEYAERKKSIKEFRTKLAHYVANESDTKPLIFIIDELDRCRPNYAVSLLEQIKHFFSIPNIVFIISIDKEQLGNAVCGVYGSDKIDSNEYLRRFIDLEYSIPEPEPKKYFNYLYNQYKFDEFLNSKERLSSYELKYDADSFKSISEVLLSDLTLRQQEKIMSHSRIVLRTLKTNNYLIPIFFTFLIYIKVIHNNFYIKLIRKNGNIQEIQNDFYEIIRTKLNNENNRYFISIEGYLLMFYQNYLNQFKREVLLFEYISNTNEYKLNINSKINDKDLLNFFTSVNGINRTFDLSLEYFVKKIELTEEIIIS